MLKSNFIALLVFVFGQICLAEKVLIVGDSHSCGQLGATLIEELSLQGKQVHLFCTVSSSPVHWLTGSNPKGQNCNEATSENKKQKLCGGAGRVPRLDSILNQGNYDSAIVVLGTNSLYSPIANSSFQDLAELVRRKTKKCIWVGPPHLRSDQASASSSKRIFNMENNVLSFYESLNSRISPACELINSLKVTENGGAAESTRDGVHRTNKAGVAWAQDVLSKIQL